jgi:hypothetical protein
MLKRYNRKNNIPKKDQEVIDFFKMEYDSNSKSFVAFKKDCVIRYKPHYRDRTFKIFS